MEAIFCKALLYMLRGKSLSINVAGVKGLN